MGCISRYRSFFLLVDLDFGTLAGEVGHADPKVRHSAPHSNVPRLFEDRLNVHGELDPFVDRFATGDRGQHGCRKKARNQHIIGFQFPCWPTPTNNRNA